MIFKYKHFLKEDSNYLKPNRPPSTTLDWLVADTQELFEKHYNEHPNSIHLQNYISKPIKYKLNNYGFRTNDDFNKFDIGNIFLGCSHTFGIGHHLKNVWSYKLSQTIGDRFYNLGEPGSGIMEQYRILFNFIDKLKVKNVFHYLPDEDWYRYEYIKESGAFGKVMHKQLPGSLLNTFFNDKQVHFINYIYIDAIRHLLNERGITYYLYTNSYANVDNMDPYHKEWTPARDLLHYYIEEQDEIYKIFLYKYKNKMSDNVDNELLLKGVNPLNPKVL